jgi:hypothetical protein
MHGHRPCLQSRKLSRKRRDGNPVICRKQLQFTSFLYQHKVLKLQRKIIGSCSVSRCLSSTPQTAGLHIFIQQNNTALCRTLKKTTFFVIAIPQIAGVTIYKQRDCFVVPQLAGLLVPPKAGTF